MAHVAENTPYLNPDLSMRDLAGQIHLHPNHLTWILNQRIGKNFNEFINSYRLETFMTIAKAQENENYTIEGLAYESGFNSKTVFNTYFKRATGVTPKQFLSFLYIIAGEREKALDHLEIAHCLNPLSDETHFFRAYYHYMIEDFPGSLELLDQCLSSNDKNIPAHSIKPLCLLKLGRYREVISYYDQIPAGVVIEGEKTGAIGLAYSLMKDKVNASLYEEKLNKRAKEASGYTEDSFLFLMHAVAGDRDKAFNWVEGAIEKKSSLMLLRLSLIHI